MSKPLEHPHAKAVRPSETLLVCLSALLLAIWPLPETILLRNLALLGGLVLGIGQLWQLLRSGTALRRFWPVPVLLAFFPWLLWHVLVWPTLPDEQWYDLGGDWARAFCACITGLGLGLILAHQPRQAPEEARRHNRILLLGLSATVLIYAARYAYEVYQTGALLHHDFYEHPYAGKTASVVFGGLFLIALCIRLLDTLRGGRLSARSLAYGVGLVLVLANFYLANTKNGFIVFFACTLLFLRGWSAEPWTHQRAPPGATCHWLWRRPWC